MAALGITQSKASRHLITLKHAGLVADRRDGLWSHYALCSPADDLVRTHLDLLKRNLAQRPEAAPLMATLQDWLDGKGRADCRPSSAETKGKGKSPRVSAKASGRTR